MNTLSETALHPAIIIVILLAFFGAIVLAVILVKKYVKPLQINKPDIDEKEAAQQELDRILVPIEDEEIQKEMDKAALNDENNGK